LTEQTQQTPEVSPVVDVDFDEGYREARTKLPSSDESGATATEAAAKPEAATEPAEIVQDDEAAAGDEDDVELPKGVQKKIQREIDKAVRARKEAEELLKQAKNAGNGNPDTKPGPVEAKPAEPTEPKREDYVVKGVLDGTFADYDAADAAFTKDLTTFTYTRERAKDQEAQKKADSEAAARKAWDDRVSPVKAKYTDYDQVISGPEVKANEAVLYAVANHPQAPELVYHLLKNPAEVEQLNALSSIGEVFEALVDVKNRYITTPAKPPAPPRVSSAPAPISPVGGSKPAVQKSISDMDFDEGYRAKRERQRR
jgi:hypothetical protein